MRLTVIAIIFLAGCASPNSRQFIVLDETGKPIAGATSHPQKVDPIWPAKRSDEKGRMKVYRLHDIGIRKVTAEGYEPSQLDYYKDAIVTLKRKDEKN